MTRLHNLHNLKKAFLVAFRESGNVSQSAKLAGVHRRTVYGWLKRSSEFEAAFKDAEGEAAERLEQALWDVAVPHPTERVTTELLRGPDGLPLKHSATGEDWYAVTKITRSVEHDTTAMIALLKARCPERYRERYDVRLSGALVHVNATEALENALARIQEWENDHEELPQPALPEGPLN